MTNHDDDATTNAPDGDLVELAALSFAPLAVVFVLCLLFLALGR